jgi:LCP family protein required for cell wall assembly
VLIVVTGLVLTAIAVVVGVVVVIDSSLTRVDVDGLAGDEPAGVADGQGPQDADGQDPAVNPASSVDPEEGSGVEPVTMLLLGSDSREVLTPQERTELGTGMAYGERTEVVALLRLDADAEELRMVNIPRDAHLTLCDGSQGRINAAYGIGERDGTGGMSCVVETMSRWSGVPIDHAAMVDFRGFVDIVDAIGGIDMHLDQPLYDQRANLDLGAGCQHLDGAEALAFARARGLDNDFGRIARQQRLLVELRDQVAQMGVFSEPLRTLRLAESVASSLEVDSSLTLNRIRQLVMQHRETLQADLDARTVPGEKITGTEAWLLAPDEEEAEALFTWLLEGDAATASDAEVPGAADEGTADDQERAPVASEPDRCD